MGKTIGIFVGSLSSPNTQRVVSNHGWMLGEQFDLDLITTNPRRYEKQYFQRIIGGQFHSSPIGSIKALRLYLEDCEPDVLYHANRPQIHGLLITLLGERTTATTVYRYPGDTFRLYQVAKGWKRVPYFLLNNVIGRAPLSLTDKAVALGPNGREQLTSRGLSASDICILPPSIDVDEFQNGCPAELTVPNGREIILFVGRRTQLKGLETIEAAIPEILSRRDDLQFVFIGKGEEVNIAKKWEDHVTVVGEVPPSAVSSYYHNAELLILPSLTEGIPRVLLEALATKTPVVARNVGDVPSVTDNHFTEDASFVEMVVNFEELPLDPITPFDRSVLRQKYIEFFNKI